MFYYLFQNANFEWKKDLMQELEGEGYPAELLSDLLV